MPVTEQPPETEGSAISFRTNLEVEARGTLLTLGPGRVVFEIYGPTPALQTSEVLNDLRIHAAGRLMYSGRAVIRSLVSAGAVLVCEATLEDFWAETAEQDTGPFDLAARYRHFVERWQKFYRLSPEYKLAVVDLQSFLADLKTWTEKVELEQGQLPAAKRKPNMAEALSEAATTALSALFERFEHVAQSVNPDLAAAHASFCRRQLHPLLMCSPFMYRIFAKPLGYAGDYEMVNMILGDPSQGASLFARLLNVFILSQAPAVAHRNRVDFLAEKLVRETLRIRRFGRPARILNLGCGPAKEVQKFLAQQELSNHAEFDLLDFSRETLDYAQNAVETVKRAHGRLTRVNVVKKSVQQLLKQAGSSAPAQRPYDFIYCAGLFDYLNDRACRMLLSVFHGMLAPGGLIVATNVEGGNPIRNIMDHVFEWHLIYRTGPEFAALVDGIADPDDLKLQAEESGCNVFIEVRKRAAT